MSITNNNTYTEREANLMTGFAVLTAELRGMREQSAKENSALVSRLDKLNGSVARHAEWIAVQTPNLEEISKRMEEVEKSADETHDLVEQVRGGWKVSGLISALVSGICALAYYLTNTAGAHKS